MNKVLYIDDDDELCEVAKSILDVFGYDVTLIDSVGKLSDINWQEFELIIIDWMFSDGGAMDIYKRAVADGYENRVVVASSREVGNNQRLKFEQKGIKYLPKPFSCVSLSASVEGAMK